VCQLAGGNGHALEPSRQREALGLAQRGLLPTKLLDGRAEALARADPHVDARQEFLVAERLAHVVVGARLEPRQPLALIGQCRDHDDRQVDLAPLRAHAAAQLEPVQTRQHQVEND